MIRAPATVIDILASTSVLADLAALPSSASVVVFAEGPAPLVSSDPVLAVLTAINHGAAIAVTTGPVTDTLKRIDGDGNIAETVDRSAYSLSRMPYAVARRVIDALRAAYSEVADPRELLDALLATGFPVVGVSGVVGASGVVPLGHQPLG
jgi:2-C-methyl-D-erythritol 4-phosphate cytidylyltransferase